MNKFVDDELALFNMAHGSSTPAPAAPVDPEPKSAPVAQQARQMPQSIRGKWPVIQLTISAKKAPPKPAKTKGKKYYSSSSDSSSDWSDSSDSSSD